MFRSDFPDYLIFGMMACPWNPPRLVGESESCAAPTGFKKNYNLNPNWEPEPE